MTPTNVYNVSITTRNGESYQAICLENLRLSDIRDMIETDIVMLQQEAHSYDSMALTGDISYRIDRIWMRVEELKRIIDLLRVARDTPKLAPYTVDVELAGTLIGSINVIPAPAWKK